MLHPIQRFAPFVLGAACFTSPALADGYAVTTLDGAQSGCPGDVVTYTLIASGDNCACIIPVPIGFSPIGYVSANSTGGGGFPAAFGLTPPITGPLIPCTPDPNPGCPPHPATGIIMETFTVNVMIPDGTPAGTVDTHLVSITIGGTPALATLTTTVLDCTGGPTVDAGDSTEPWLGFMNVYELDGTTYSFGSPWGVADLVAQFDDANNQVAMLPNQINDPSPFWYVGGGMPGAPGNKIMEADLYVEVTDTYPGQLVTFEGEVLSNTFTGAHTASIFIRDFAPDFSSLNETIVPAAVGPFSISLMTDPGAGRHVQWGFQARGVNVWMGDEGPFGSVVFATGGAPPSADFCNGDGGDQMGCSDCPCGNNAAAGTLGGCINQSGLSARLLQSGSPSVTTADPNDLRFEMSGGNPNTLAVLTSGDNLAPQNMMNPCFGLGSGVQSAALDGLRCAVGNTQRHGGRPMDASGDVGLTNNGWGGSSGPAPNIAAQGGFVSGQTRYFQVFYRADALQGCMNGQNTTQASAVTFVP